MAGHELGDEPVAAQPVAPARRPAPTSSRFSFELFPPRSPAAERALLAALDHLVAAGPDFISVTYGASGSSKDASLDVIRHLLTTDVPPMAHFTAVGTSYAETSQRLREFLDAGVTRFLALRGDPPADAPDGEVVLGDLASAGELVQLIHGVQKEREPWLEHDVPGFPGAKRLGRGRDVTIAVAAFPNGHPRSRSRAQDLDTLLAKEAAGANLAITQLFFEADDYLGFVADARAAGVRMPILPGIMPVLSAQRLERAVELAGERMPEQLLRGLRSADDPASVGVAHASRLAADVLAGGAPGIHLYTFNRPEAPLSVLREVGLLDTTRIPA